MFCIFRDSLPPILYLQMDNCGRENKNRFVIGLLCLLVEKKVFHKIKLSFLMVGHTHEDIDRSFSMFSRWLRKNNALTPRELIDGYEKSVDGTGIQLTEVHDVSQWLDGSMENLQNHSKPHTFRIKANPEGKAVIHWKKWTSDLTWNTCASERDDAFLLRDIPQNQPKVMSPNCAKLNLDIFEKDINKCVKMQKNPRVLPEWQRFIADLKTSEKDQNENNYEESSLWMLDEIIKATSTRARQNSTLLTSEDSSDEDAPIPHVIIGKGPRKPDRLQKPKKNS